MSVYGNYDVFRHDLLEMICDFHLDNTKTTFTKFFLKYTLVCYIERGRSDFLKRGALCYRPLYVNITGANTATIFRNTNPNFYTFDISFLSGLMVILATNGCSRHRCA